jgi:hypothetical protein
LLVPLRLLHWLLRRALRLLLDTLLLRLLLPGLPGLHALLRRLLGPLRLLPLLRLRSRALPLRRLLLHSLLLLRRLRGTLLWLLRRWLLRPLRPLWLDARLRLCPLRLYPLRLLLLHSRLLGCGLRRTFRLLRPFGMLLRSRPAPLLLTLFVFLVLRVHRYRRSHTQKEHGSTRYS